MGNPGVYGRRKFELLDYSEGVARGEIATTAIDTAHLKDAAVTVAKVSTTLKRQAIHVQTGASAGTFYLGSLKDDVDLSEVGAAIIAGAVASAGTVATLTVDIKKATAGATLAADLSQIATVTLGAATASLIKGTTQALSGTLAAGEILVADVTTAGTLSGSGIIIQYSKA